MCHGGNPLPSASLEGTMSDPTCRCVGVSLNFPPFVRTGPSRSTPKNQSRKRIFESTSSKCASKKYDITVWRAEESVIAHLEDVPQAVNNAIRSNRAF